MNDASDRGKLIVPGAIVVSGVIIAGAILWVNRASRPSPASVSNPAAVANQNSPKSPDLADDAPFLGSPNAPVTLVEFGDFQCPFCGRFFKATEPQIIENYVNTGKVKFVYRDFAFLGPESESAAAAAECANEQGKFWPYHNLLYQNQNGENQGAFSDANLKSFAGRAGLDAKAFVSCFESGKYTKKVQEETAVGRDLGVSGTPTIFINGRPVVGALPFSQFQALIEQSLSGK